MAISEKTLERKCWRRVLASRAGSRVDERAEPLYSRIILIFKPDLRLRMPKVDRAPNSLDALASYGCAQRLGARIDRPQSEPLLLPPLGRDHPNACELSEPRR